MPLKVFPTHLFPPQSKEIDRELARMSGGQALNGTEDTLYTDGGGRWYVSLDGMALYDRQRVMAMRALKAGTHDGALPIVVRFCDSRHQPTRGRQRVTHSDDTSFSDGTLYRSGDCKVYAAADAPLRATQISLTIVALGKPLIGGERFTIVHPTMRERAYQIGEVVSQSATAAVVKFVTPLREAVTAGTAIDFMDPRCVMRWADGGAAPLAGPRWASTSIRFVEDFSGSYS